MVGLSRTVESTGSFTVSGGQEGKCCVGTLRNRSTRPTQTQGRAYKLVLGYK